MKSLYYFAYGSNLLTSRLRNRIGNAKILRTHILHGYKLVLDFKGFANIEPSEGDFVEGVLYKINSTQLKELNHYEGFYEEHFFDIGNNDLAVVYIGEDKWAYQRKPDLHYINTILDGLEEHGLHHTFDKVVEFKEKNYKLAFGSKHKKKAKI